MPDGVGKALKEHIKHIADKNKETEKNNKNKK